MAAKLGRSLTKEEVSVLIGLGYKEGREFVACNFVPDQTQIESVLPRYPVTNKVNLSLYTDNCIRIMKDPDCGTFWAHLLEYEEDE